MQVDVSREGRLGRSAAALLRERAHWLALGLVLAAASGFHLLTLMRTPYRDVDEPWLMSRAYGLIQTGKPFGPLDAGVVDRYPGHWVAYPYLLTWLHALAARAFGLTLLSGRLVSLAGGLALLMAVYGIAGHLGGRRVGLLAVALTALSEAFFLSAHTVRQDVYVAAVGFLAILLYVTDGSQGFSVKSFLSGLIATLAVDFHLTALFYAAVIGVLYLMDHQRAVLRSKRFWGFLAGAIAGFAVWAIVHVAPYPQTYLRVCGLVVESSRVPPILALDPVLWARSLWEAALTMIRAGKPWLTVPGAYTLLKWGKDGERRIVEVFAAMLVVYAAIVANKPAFYTIMVSPMASILAAAFATQLLGKGKRLALRPDARARRASHLLAVAICALIAVELVVADVSLLADDPMPDYRAAAEQIREAVPPGSSLIGPQTYWFDLPDRRYVSWEQIIYYRRYAPGSSLDDAFRALRPDYLVVDRHLRLWIVDDRQDTPANYEEMWLPPGDMRRFLAQRGHIVSQFSNRLYGPVAIYRLAWD